MTKQEFIDKHFRGCSPEYFDIVSSDLDAVSMKKLENKLKELQKLGYENISINQVIQWMAEIRRDNLIKNKSKKVNKT